MVLMCVCVCLRWYMKRRRAADQEGEGWGDGRVCRPSLRRRAGWSGVDGDEDVRCQSLCTERHML